MQEINGVTLKRYAELICATTDTVTEEEFWQALEKEGFSRDAWQPIKDGWNAELFKPENYLTLQQEYNNALEEAVEKKNNGNPPCSLETFADLNAQFYYRKDPANNNEVMEYTKVLESNNIAPLKWTEYSAYWAPKTARDEYSQKYYDLLNIASAKYMET